MNPEPIYLDFILDTPVKAEDLRTLNITTDINRDYKYTRVGCVDIYNEFFAEVNQLRESMLTNYKKFKPYYFTVDLLATQIHADEVSGITLEIDFIGNEYFTCTKLHDYSHDRLLQERQRQQEVLYDNLKRESNTTSEVKFYLAELEKIDKSILHLHQQQSLRQLSKL